MDLHSAEHCKRFWLKQDEIKWKDKKHFDRQRRLQTSNLCPIYIEYFQFNFFRMEKILINNHDYWDRLNGRQKMKSFKNHVKQTMKVLLYELV